MVHSTEARATAGLSDFTHRALQSLLDLLYPPRCAGCGQVDTPWCPRCARELSAVPNPLHLHTPPGLTACAATAHHEGAARKAVHALKFEHCEPMAAVLGARLAEALRVLQWPAGTLIPVPLHATRLRERGYNQAQWLAEAAAPLAGLECLSDGLVRTRATPHQVGASAAGRQAQVKDAFQAVSSRLLGRHVILVDDVFTTGATLQACAQAALAGGAAAVFSLTVTAARAGAAGAV